MPMSKLEEALSAAADAFEAHVDEEVKADIERLCGNNQRPYIVRLPNSCPGHMLLVQVAKEGAISP